MTQFSCGPENSIVEDDLEVSALQKTITKLKVMETPVGFYVIVMLKWAAGKEWYLTTRRDRNTPKVFKDLTRLNEHLKSACPAEVFEVYHDQELPPRSLTAKTVPNSKLNPIKNKTKNKTKVTKIK